MSNGGGTLGDLVNRTVHSMAIDETGERLFLITDKGLTVVQLDSLPLSIGSVTPASGAAGTQVTVRGSGFVQGVTASANGTSATVSYVDSSTLDLKLPSLPAGAVQINITNPDGQAYTIDDAYTVQSGGIFIPPGRPCIIAAFPKRPVITYPIAFITRCWSAPAALLSGGCGQQA